MNAKFRVGQEVEVHYVEKRRDITKYGTYQYTDPQGYVHVLLDDGSGQHRFRNSRRHYT